MAILPLEIDRVSNLLRSGVATQSIDSTQQQLLTVQNELATGKSVNEPSDNPGAASTIIQLQQSLDRTTAYTANINQANTNLGQVDSSLSDLTNVIQSAVSSASANVGSDVTATQRQDAAAVVQSLYSQAQSIGNQSLGGTYLFGGVNATNPPFVETSGGVQFVGSTNLLENAINDGTAVPIQANGAQVFGGLSTRTLGGTSLNPNLTAQTQLANITGATGIGFKPGQIQIGDGTVTRTVDLSEAKSVGDIVNEINAAGIGSVTASIGASGLVLTGSSSETISVNEAGANGTAASLGILQSTPLAAGAPLDGSSLGALITPVTSLASLRGGAGLDLSGLTLTTSAKTYTISFAGATDVQDVLNDINKAGAGVTASINRAGTGIQIVGNTQGQSVAVGENGGTTAAELGVATATGSTLLSSLNGGKGVGLVTGNDLSFTRSDGTSFQVNLAGANTVQDVINDINAASGSGGLTASLSSTTGGIVLTDTAGGSGTPSVTSINGSTAAADLGLTNAASGNVINGAPLDPLTTNGVFSDLSNLITALQTNNQAGITSAGAALQNDLNNVVVVRGQVGAQVQNLQAVQNNLAGQTTATQTLISNLQDADYAATVTQFQTLQTALQADLQSTASTLQLTLLNFLA